MNAAGRSLGILLTSGAAFASIAIGILSTVEPVLALAPLGLLVGLLLATDARFRLPFVVFGGLAALQSSAQLNAAKGAYFAGAAIAVTAAYMTYRRAPREGGFDKLVAASGVFSLGVILSGAVAGLNGTTISEWARDSVAYLLAGSAPLLAVDAARSLSQRTLVILFSAAGSITAIAFAVEWIERRGFAELSISRVAFSSFLFAAALFCYTVARALARDERGARWMLLSGVVFSLLLVTGTRSTLLLLVSPLVLVLGSKNRTATILRFALVVPAAALVAVIASQGVAGAVGIDTEIMTSRLSTVGAAVSAPGEDQSYAERLAQTRSAWEAFVDEPVFGVGPGSRFAWSTSFGPGKPTYRLDTAASFPAKFGLVGLALLLLVVFRYLAVVRGALARSVPAQALMAFLATVLVWTLLGSPFEDKGFSFGLMFLLALTYGAKEVEG